MSICLLLTVALLIVVANAIVVRAVIRRFVDPEVWDGKLELVLDNGNNIPLSFQISPPNVNIDIPKGRRIEKIILKDVKVGCVPIVCLSSCEGDISAQFVIRNFSLSNQRRTDIEYQVTNPRKLPSLVGLAVCSNGRIAGGEQRSTPGLFWPRHDISLWYDRPGAN